MWWTLKHTQKGVVVGLLVGVHNGRERCVTSFTPVGRSRDSRPTIAGGRRPASIID